MDVDALRFRSPGQRSHASYGARPRRRDGLCRVSSSPTQSRPPVRRARLARFVARRAWAWGGSLTLIPDGDRSGRCDSQKSNLISSHLVCVCARARMLRIIAITVHSSSWTPEAKKKKEHRRPVSLVSLSIDEQLPPQHWEVEIPSRCTPCCWSEMPRA